MSRSSTKRLVQEFSNYQAENFKHLPAFFRAFARDILLPLFMTFALIYMAFLIQHTVNGNTKSAYDLHHQALLMLQRQPGRNERARDLLQRAMEQDSRYMPAIYSLAAYYIYVEMDAIAAMNVLSTAKQTEEMDELLADAQALASGNASMIQTSLRMKKYLSLQSL